MTIDADMELKMQLFARELAQEVVRLQQQQGALMLPGEPAETRYPACGTGAPKIGCENLLYAPITVAKFYRGGRTDIDQVEEGQLPVGPGTSIVLSQRPHPPWATGCYVLRYRLANNGQNHDEIKIEWMIDGEPLDTAQYGSEIYNVGGTIIGDGKLPIPLAGGEQCCIGGNNRLRVRITHTGNANAIENIRLHVEHAQTLACCSGCAGGHTCQRGCRGKHK